VSDADIEGSQMPPVLSVILTVVGFALLLVAGFFYLAAGLIVPGPWLYILWVIWILLFVYAVRNWQRPVRVLVTPLVAAVIWFLYAQGGSWLFGWTA
jgi:hypothetical protein